MSNPFATEERDDGGDATEGESHDVVEGVEDPVEELVLCTCWSGLLGRCSDHLELLLASFEAT